MPSNTPARRCPSGFQRNRERTVAWLFGCGTMASAFLRVNSSASSASSSVWHQAVVPRGLVRACGVGQSCHGGFGLRLGIEFCMAGGAGAWRQGRGAERQRCGATGTVSASSRWYCPADFREVYPNKSLCVPVSMKVNISSSSRGNHTNSQSGCKWHSQ